MRLHNIVDAGSSAIHPKQYDVALFAAGYEPRCTYVATKHFPRAYDKAAVLGFHTLSSHTERVRAEGLFLKYFGEKARVLSDGADQHIYEVLAKHIPAGSQSAEIFIDYSSMTRLWYAAILSWVRFHPTLKSAMLHFAYTPGRYQGNIPTSQLAEIGCIPGCEGGTSTAERSNAIVGLGFDALSALCVLDKLEPDQVFAFYTAPAVVPDYANQTQEKNRMILERCRNRVLSLPMSVAACYAALAELISPFLGKEDVSIIPMGPKPHVLASILLAIRFPAIACLYARSADREAWRADPTDQVFVTTVEFRAQRTKGTDKQVKAEYSDEARRGRLEFPWEPMGSA